MAFGINDTNSHPYAIEYGYRQVSLSRYDRNIRYYILFPDAECGENMIQDVVGCCGTGNRVDRI